MEHPDGPSHMVGNIAETLTKPVKRGPLGVFKDHVSSWQDRCTTEEMTLFIFIGITKASNLNTVTMRNNNSFIYKRGTRWLSEPT